MSPFELVALIAINLLAAASAVGRTGNSPESDWHTEYRTLATAANDGASVTGMGSAQSPSIATASGSRCRVATLVYEFALPKRNLREWVLQRRIRVGTVDLGMIKARVIVDEDEEKELLGFQP
jgi:hypothetical protein